MDSGNLQYMNFKLLGLESLEPHKTLKGADEVILVINDARIADMDLWNGKLPEGYHSDVGLALAVRLSDAIKNMEINPKTKQFLADALVECANRTEQFDTTRQAKRGLLRVSTRSVFSQLMPVVQRGINRRRTPTRSAMRNKNIEKSPMAN